MLPKKYPWRLVSVLFSTLLCWLRIIAQTEAGAQCSCFSRSLSDESNIACKVTSDCAIASHPAFSAFTMENTKVRMKTKKEGLVITWITRFSEDEAQPVAYFTLERIFSMRNTCNLIILNASKDLYYTRKTNASVELDCASKKSRSSMSYTLTLAPKRAITSHFSMDSTNMFSGQVLVPEDDEHYEDVWLASAFVQQERENCSRNSRLLLTFSPPHFHTSDPYRVMICIDGHACNNELRRFVTRTTEVAVYNVTPGHYFIWISPDNEVDGNSATSDHFSVLDLPTPTWNSDLNTTSSCRTDTKTCCAEINYQPAESALQYEGYTVYVRRGTTKLEALRTADKHVGHAMVCELTPGLYDIEVSPHGACPQWIKSHKSTLSLNIIEPLTATDNKTSIAITGILTAAAVMVCIIVASRWLKHRYGSYFVTGKSSHGPVYSCGRNLDEKISEFEGAVFGGHSTSVLLLYARDHEFHVQAVKDLAEILQLFGGLTVTIDQWCERDEVQKNDWLKKQITSADAVAIVPTAGARFLHEAFVDYRVYPKYARRAPAPLQVPEVLKIAEKMPSLRQKMLSVNFEYSPSAASLSELSLPEFAIPAQFSDLVCHLHGAPSLSKWSCQQQCQDSPQYKSLLRHISRMSDLYRRKPHLVQRVFGRPEDRLDSGIDQLSSRVRQDGSFDASVGVTEVRTLFSSDFNRHGEWTDSEANGGHLTVQSLILRTDIPRVEDTWRTYARQESVPSSTGSADMVSADRFITALGQISNTSHASDFYYLMGAIDNLCCLDATETLSVYTVDESIETTAGTCNASL